ncbi:MAG: vWA domain-containing protein, partial [Myxococcota bacterium]
MSLVLGLALVALGVLPTGARAQDLIVDGETRVLGGVQRFSRIEVINGGRIEVLPFDGTDREGTGNLVLVADAILVDATSTISARGSGYQVLRCGDGDGPVPGAGGAGGCSVRDSGGGGAHFGAGGRGTKDCFVFGSRTTCQFPEEFEEDCGNTLNAAGSACSSRANCNDLDGLPTVAGAGYFHSIWEVEFGAAGGDKGCRDGDGFGSQPVVGGPGGGRIVLAGVNATETGSVTIAGTLDADGKRGCGTGNDSGGGGAGGTILVVADVLTVADTAVLSAAGGLGGDTNARAGVRSEDCPTNAQAPGGTCDDCGGGGGGGLISLLSRGQAIAAGADFDVGGAAGGECPICEGEAGGGAGELQLNRLYQGETCDGFDNDFDGFVDEGLGTFTCGLGSCATSLDACTAGVATSCVPDTVGAGCTAPPVCDEPRVLVILDTSASMLQDLDGGPTFGDGSLEHPGLDTDGDGDANDARLFLAKEAVSQLISNYPEIDFALARYAQDTSADQSCQLAAWIECAGIFATYDDPGDNTGPVECIVDVGAGTRTIRRVSTGEECINYAGSCGDPRRGADILAGFGSDTRDVVRWLDGRETDFRTGTATGDYCAHADGGDCELRATGPTPLEGALDAAFDYITPIQTTDPCTACRGYSVILVTDGAESCDGDPATAAEALFDAGIEVEVVAVSVLASEEASLNAIARAGSGDARDATFVRTPGDLVPTLTRLVAGAIRVEQCNGADDDCDLAIDEGFPGLGDACADDGIGICQGTGAIECRADGSGTECSISRPGGVRVVVVCTDLADDCDGGIDEGLTCTGECTPTGPEVCNGLDDNCNGAIDETDPAVGTACGDDEGACR